MDLRKLKTLIDLVSESNVSELEITEAEGKVRIVKSEGVVHQYVAAPVQAAPSGCNLGCRTRCAAVAELPAPAGGPCGQVAHGRYVLPFLQPGAKPFVDVGSQVKEGDTSASLKP
jgi:acetyl-CoA carboxylase biotin carboxyl carrier protein